MKSASRNWSWLIVLAFTAALSPLGARGSQRRTSPRRGEGLPDTQTGGPVPERPLTGIAPLRTSPM